MNIEHYEELILAAMSQQMVNRRGPEFTELYRDVTTRLKTIYNTSGDVLLFPAMRPEGRQERPGLSADWQQKADEPGKEA